MRFLRNSAILICILLVAFWLSLAPGDPALYPAKPDEKPWNVYVVDHGWHTGLILRTDDIAAAALAMPEEKAEAAGLLLSLARIMGAGDWVEIGWGDEAFYFADVADASEVPPLIGLRALVVPTDTVLHVFPGLGDPAVAFPASETLKLEFSEAGFAAIALAVGNAIAGKNGLPEDLGAGLYGYARFYRAKGAYSALRTCNNWAAEMLRAGGAPASWATSALSSGLMAELRLRADPK